jgi:hypothetical protein
MDPFISFLTYSSCLFVFLFFRYSRFQGVANLTLHFSDNFGGDTTKIYYIGLRGEATQVPESYLFNPKRQWKAVLMIDHLTLPITEQKRCCGDNRV